MPLRRNHDAPLPSVARNGDQAQAGGALRDSKLAQRRHDLLGVLRKSNKDGAIAQWVKRLYKASEEVDVDEDEEEKTRKLEHFANICPMQGEKLVACDMLSIFNDRWFGQWLALRKPFRRLEDLLDKAIVDKAGLG